MAGLLDARTTTGIIAGTAGTIMVTTKGITGTADPTDTIPTREAPIIYPSTSN